MLFSHSLQGTGGITVKKTGMSLVIDVYDEPMTPGQRTMIVERLGSAWSSRVCKFVMCCFGHLALMFAAHFG
jgi:hypothetical protein